jgi:hypothetical protein
VSLGAIGYAAGLLAWRGGQALGLRILGWVLTVTAMVIPSTLTLTPALPLVAVLAVALPHPGAGRAGWRAKLTPARAA